MRSWTKSAYTKHVVTLVTDLLGEYGYSPVGKDLRLENVQSPEVSSSISIAVVSQKTADATVALDIYASITLRSVADLCEKLFGRETSVATIGGPIGRFLKVDTSRHGYRFNWNLTEAEQLLKLKNDLLEFVKFSRSISSVKDLDAEALARIPVLRKNFAQGLGETYKYTAPEVAAVIHKLNSRADRAVLALGVAERSGRLSADQLARIMEFIRSD